MASAQLGGTVSRKSSKQRTRKPRSNAKGRPASRGGQVVSKANWSIDDLPVELRTRLDELMGGNLPGRFAEEHLNRRAERAIKKKRPRTRREKFAAILVSPAFITGLAGAIPPAAIDLTHQTVQAVSTLIHHNSSNSPSSSKSTSNKSGSAGGEYYFGGEWQSAANRTAAIQAAKDVVDLALKRTGNESAIGAIRRIYIQWILAGNMTPAEVAQVVATAGVFDASVNPQFESLVQTMRDDIYLRPIGGDYTLSEEWVGFAESAGTGGVNRVSVVRMAEAVVDVASQRAGNALTDETKRRCIQWVLEGNVTPIQAGQILLWESPGPSASMRVERLMKMILDLSST